MSKSELNFSAEGSQISNYQKEFKSPKIKITKIADLDERLLFSGALKLLEPKNTL